MMTARRTDPASESDSASAAELWQLVCQGSAPAFEAVVGRYQALVCAVAYSACGNLAQSEDVAQETFWTAWRQRASLDQPGRLGSWLCGIARNLGKNARRKASRPAESAAALTVATALSDDRPGPAEAAVSREEESLVWKALEQIPAAYREPLILFYREDQSVADVAGAMDLTEDAVKQRLSRGRGMLREQVAELIEGGLRRSRPGRKFTVAVMAGVTAQATIAQSAVAGAGAGAWKAAVGAGVAGGTAGGLFGSLIGLSGGWLGTWVAAQAAPTRREREATLRAGLRMLLVSVGLTLGLFALIEAFAGRRGYLIAWAVWMTAFWTYIAVECVLLVRALNRIRALAAATDVPNDTALRAGWRAMATRLGDRVYRSEATFLGFPLIDVNLSAPMPPGATKPSGQTDQDFDSGSDSDSGRRVARGWIAIGDDARGILLAVGGKARGFVAVGGRALGVFSLGGFALGLVAFGGLALGVVGIGGLGAGAYALGGGAVGWRSAGGLAVGWDVACGGGALARHAAFGGAAIARDYALGGEAHARHANDAAATAVFRDHPFVRLALTCMGARQVLETLGAGGTPAPPTAMPGRLLLENGLTAMIRPIRGTGDVALLVLYRIGGDHDPQGKSGLAHLVEHLYVTAAAGTEPARTADAFFQRYRAGCNAQTGDRYTVVATVFPQQDLESELAAAAARMADLRITAADFDREKTRLLDEVANMFGRIPALGAVNNARELIRPAPRGGRKGGLPDDVATITLADVRAHWARFYKPKSAILVLAGAVEEKPARQAVTKHFARLATGEPVPTPGSPGPAQAGALRERTVPVLQRQEKPQACLAYAAPEPESALYAPFLVLVARFYAASAQPGGAAGRPSVYFPLLEDPAVLAISAAAKPAETAAQAFARLEAFVAQTLAPPLRADERAAVRQTFAPFLGTADLPDFVLARNPYGVALSLARREQLGIDPARLIRAFDDLTENSLRRAAGEVFAPGRHAGAFIAPDAK
ncbi:MAG: sigma-70 family RNA polymerase sigma factor [Isosphaeraceae bacterium]